MDEIMLKLSEKRKIREEFGIPHSTLNYALEGKRDTALTRIIRKRAMEIVEARSTHLGECSSKP